MAADKAELTAQLAADKAELTAQLAADKAESAPRSWPSCRVETTEKMGDLRTEMHRRVRKALCGGYVGTTAGMGIADREGSLVYAVERLVVGAAHLAHPLLHAFSIA